MSSEQSTPMLLSRRQFLKRASASTVALCALAAAPELAFASGGEASSDGWGMLIDLTRCQGCQSCALACKEANDRPDPSQPPTELSANAYSFVDERQAINLRGEPVTRHVKRQCMHCLDAACVSACPAAAMHKTESGPVAYRANRCLGCRYCQIGCPFGVPQFDWNVGLTPEIRKCWMCYERLETGGRPACADACPTGAIRFGKRSDLLAEAHAQIVSNPGRYIDHVYGEHEVGGTSILYLSDVPFEQLGFPQLPETAPPEETEKIMTKLPFVIGGLAVVLSGASAITHRNQHEPEED